MSGSYGGYKRIKNKTLHSLFNTHSHHQRGLVIIKTSDFLYPIFQLFGRHPHFSAVGQVKKRKHFSFCLASFLCHGKCSSEHTFKKYVFTLIPIYYIIMKSCAVALMCHSDEAKHLEMCSYSFQASCSLNLAGHFLQLVIASQFLLYSLLITLFNFSMLTCAYSYLNLFDL